MEPWVIDPIVIKQINESWSYYDLIEHTIESVVVIPADPFFPPGQNRGKTAKNTSIDNWGVTWQWTKSSTTYPVPVKPAIRDKKEIDSLNVPDPLAEYNFIALKEAVKRFKGKKAIAFFLHDALDWPSNIRGQDKLLMDFIQDPSFVKHLVEIVVNYQILRIKRAISLGAEIIITGDDYCGKDGPFMSPKHFEEFVLPGLEKIVQITKEKGSFFIKHTDGNCWPIMDMLVGTGIDALNPIQPDVMDIEKVKDRYGDKIALVGNIDCGKLLSYGSPEEVMKTVKRTIEKAAPGGGYLLSSSNCIHPMVKPENYMAMLKAVEKYGKYD